jgi:25S rRNA (uracil2634-N3)-methyltransferase
MSQNDRLPTVLRDKESQVSILSVGSGDGSQQAAIVARGHSNITTTFFDGSPDDVRAKYPPAGEHLQTLERDGGPVLFGIDATQLDAAPLGKFDIVIFTFPHTGVPNQALDNAASNQALLLGFLQSVVHVLKPGGSVHITLKKGNPYDKWNLPGLLPNGSALHLSKQHPFDKSLFPGYKHRRTKGMNRGCKTVRDDGAEVYIFERRVQ